MWKVRDLMQPNVFTVGPEEMVDRVFFLIHFEKVRHLPVVDKGKVIGIVSDRDLYKTLGPSGRQRSAARSTKDSALYVIPRKVRHIMRRGVITIGPKEDAAKAAATMAKRKIGGLPVVTGNRLVGIITATDLLRAYSKLSREHEKLKATVVSTST